MFLKLLPVYLSNWSNSWNWWNECWSSVIMLLLSSGYVTAVCLDNCMKGYSTFELYPLTKKY